MNNLIDPASQYADNCSTYMGTEASTFGSLSTTQTCAEVFTSNNSEIMNKGGNPVGYNGEGGYWSGINSTTYNVWPSGSFDLVMNYGIAIKAAILMGYDHGNPYGNPDIAQEVTNYLMYGIVNTNWPYSGTVTYVTSGIPYHILPYYNSSADSSNNNPGQASIAIRDVAFGLSSNVGPNSAAVLDGLTKNWAQVNVQAAWNNRNGNNVMWSNWCQQSSTSKTPISNPSPTPTFYSWDDSAAVAGILTVPGTY